MINVEELNDIINKMSDYKPVKAIKVTTEFFDYLNLVTKQSSIKVYHQGVPVIIDDEIDGFYEIVY